MMTVCKFSSYTSVNLCTCISTCMYINYIAYTASIERTCMFCGIIHPKYKDLLNRTVHEHNSRWALTGRINFYTYAYTSLVPSLSSRQIFITYSMKNRRGKSGSKQI